jgi:hypothetical protein
MARRGATPSVQRALGWTEPRRSAVARDELTPCKRCGAALRFDVPDPERLGRSMQACTNPDCDGHVVHAMTRDVDPV